MRRFLKYLMWLALLLAVGFVGYALIFDLPAPTRDRVVTLPLPESGQ